MLRIYFVEVACDGQKTSHLLVVIVSSITSIVERYVSNVFYSERIVRVFYSQSDKILGVFYPK